MSSDKVPVYTIGWFNRKCVTCGVKTKKRVEHDIEDWTGFSECRRYPRDDKLPQHYSCHDDSSCNCDMSMRRHQKITHPHGCISVVR